MSNLIGHSLTKMFADCITTLSKALLDAAVSAPQLIRKSADKVETSVIMLLLAKFIVSDVAFLFFEDGTLHGLVRQYARPDTIEALWVFLGTPCVWKALRSVIPERFPLLECCVSMNSLIWCSNLLTIMIISLARPQGLLRRGADHGQQPAAGAVKAPQSNLYSPANHNFPVFRITEESLSSPRLDEDDRKCTICTDVFVNGDRVTKLPSCKHILHEQCCKKWWNARMSCTRCAIEYEWVPLAKGEMLRMLKSS
jgi:hypothetical protein